MSDSYIGNSPNPIEISNEISTSIATKFPLSGGTLDAGADITLQNTSGNANASGVFFRRGDATFGGQAFHDGTDLVVTSREATGVTNTNVLRLTATAGSATLNGNQLVTAGNIGTYALTPTNVGTYAVTASNIGTYAVLTSADSALAAGVTTTSVNDGTKTTGTYTPTPAGGNMKQAVNNGAHTLAAPSAAGEYSILIHYTNGASAGAITLSGFTKSSGDPFTTTNGHKFLVYITKIATSISVFVQALQ